MLAVITRSEWELHTVGEVMRRDLSALTIAPDRDALDALARMQREGVSRLLVTERDRVPGEGDRLVGIVSLQDLMRFLSLKLELEGPDEPGNGPGAAAEEPRQHAVLHQ
jgi:predicted transcriptional regulator